MTSSDKIMIVGEAFGREEAEAGRPFVGSSGRLLRALLSQSGIRADDCYLTNVFNFQPHGNGFPDNDLRNICGPKAEAVIGLPAVQSGKYIRREFQSELTRLYDEIKRERPTLILALGATASWALLGTTGIKKIRGAPSVLSGPALTSVAAPLKVFPTYHPAAVLREYGLRPIVLADLAKARREATFPDLIRPRREIWIEPTLDDLSIFERDYILPSHDLSVDIETARDQITCVGFAPSTDRAIVVPFVNPLVPSGNYWATVGDELAAWGFVQRWLQFSKRVVGQNLIYDMHFLWRRYGLTIPNYSENDDTMLMHHAMQPELEKGLGFLATIYTDELPWKFMRQKHETLKRED